LKRDVERAASATDQARALYEFLGARSGEEPSAWEGRDLGDWSRHRPSALDGGLLGEFEACTTALDRERWAGNDSPQDPGRLLALADHLIGEGF